MTDTALDNSIDESPKLNESTSSTTEDNEELEAIKRKVKEMQEEAERLEQIQKQVDEQITPAAGGGHRDSKDSDKRSIYVGNVDYGTTPEELQAHFQSCGTINRITILCDKITGHPKGYAYVEFLEEESVQNAMLLSEDLFRNRPLKIVPKRTNVPGVGIPRYNPYSRGYPRPWRGGRPFRGRPRRAFYHPYYS